MEEETQNVGILQVKQPALPNSLCFALPCGLSGKHGLPNLMLSEELQIFAWSTFYRVLNLKPKKVLPNGVFFHFILDAYFES